jgi:MoaA/NifB/PqqE/SkfB family radical SAM enzyme
MSKKMWNVLETAVKLGYSKNIELHYATNGTHWPKEYVDIFKHFRHLNLNFSIDGIGKHFEYMRYPANWEEAQQNMEYAREFKKSHHDMQLSWCSTLSILNIYALPVLLEEFYKTYGNDFGIYLNLVHGPVHFNISKIRPDVKLKVLERLRGIDKKYSDIWFHYLPGIINFIEQGSYDSKIWEEFKSSVAIHDNYRNQKYSDTFPDFAEIARIY